MSIRKTNYKKRWSQVSKGEDDLKYKEAQEPQEFITEVATVRCAMGRTVNVGDYNSARFDVGVELPCYVEEIGKARKAAKKLCEIMISELLDEAGVE